MAEAFRISISSNAREALRELEQAPPEMMRAIVKEMDKQNQLTMAHIIRKRLTGKGPFPVPQHRLGVVTNRLRSSLNATPAVARGSSVASTIGTNVEYAGAHEFGFDGEVKVPRHQVSPHSRIRTHLIGSDRNKSKVSVRGHMRGPFTRHMKMPKRMPILSGIRDRQTAYGQALSDAIIKTWNELGSRPR